MNDWTDGWTNGLTFPFPRGPRGGMRRHLNWHRFPRDVGRSASAAFIYQVGRQRVIHHELVHFLPEPFSVDSLKETAFIPADLSVTCPFLSPPIQNHFLFLPSLFSFLSATKSTVPWRTIARWGQCLRSSSVLLPVFRCRWMSFLEQISLQYNFGKL